MQLSLRILPLMLCAGCATPAASPATPTEGSAAPDGAAAASTAEPEALLDVSVTCRDRPDCLPKGRELVIVVRITNNERTPVAVPLAYLRRVGPAVRVIDARTRTATYLSTSLADPGSRGELTSIEPGASVSFEWVIPREQLPQTGLGTADISAEVTVKMEVEREGKTMQLVGSDKIRIGQGGR